MSTENKPFNNDSKLLRSSYNKPKRGKYDPILLYVVMTSSSEIVGVFESLDDAYSMVDTSEVKLVIVDFVEAP